MKKKKILTFLFLIMAITTLTGCNQEKDNNSNNNNDSNQSGVVENSSNSENNNKGENLPNWRGIRDHYGYIVVGKGMVSIDISYPSLKPASSGCAYQMDPAVVLVTDPGLTKDMEDIWVDNFEDTFSISKNNIIMYIENFRDYHYDNFDFVIKTQELMTINGLETCKYTGKHTYTFDGVAKEIPFVAYSVDTKQVERTYPTILVMDDSINNPSMDPLPEGTIEAYAKKMVESIVVRK